MSAPFPLERLVPRFFIEPGAFIAETLANEPFVELIRIEANDIVHWRLRLPITIGRLYGISVSVNDLNGRVGKTKQSQPCCRSIPYDRARKLLFEFVVWVVEKTHLETRNHCGKEEKKQPLDSKNNKVLLHLQFVSLLPKFSRKQELKSLNEGVISKLAGFSSVPSRKLNR